MRDDLLRVGYRFFASTHNSKVSGVYIKGNLLRIDHLFIRRRKRVFGWFKTVF